MLFSITTRHCKNVIVTLIRNDSIFIYSMILSHFAQAGRIHQSNQCCHMCIEHHSSHNIFSTPMTGHWARSNFCPEQQTNKRRERIYIFGRLQKLFMPLAKRNTCSSNIPLHLRDVPTVSQCTWQEILCKYLQDISPSLPLNQNGSTASCLKSHSLVMLVSARVALVPLCLRLLPLTAFPLVFSLFAQSRDVASDLAAQCH